MAACAKRLILLALCLALLGIPAALASSDSTSLTPLPSPLVQVNQGGEFGPSIAAPEVDVAVNAQVADTNGLPALPALPDAQLALDLQLPVALPVDPLSTLGPDQSTRPEQAPKSAPVQHRDAVSALMSSPALPAAEIGVGAWFVVSRLMPQPFPLRRLLGNLFGTLTGFGAGAVGQFSRIQEGEVLEHATRQGIVNNLLADPGLSLQDLQARQGVAWGTLVHHVRILEAHGKVVSIRQGPRRLLYVANTPEASNRADLALLHAATAHRVALAVQEHPGIQQLALCTELGLRGPAASKQLAKLEAAGLVHAAREGRGVHYQGTPRLAAALELAGASRPLVSVAPVMRDAIIDDAVAAAA